MGKKLKFGKIRIYFRDGKVDVIPRRLYDTYEYTGSFFVVTRGGAWVYMYNLKDISAIIVHNEKVKVKA